MCRLPAPTTEAEELARLQQRAAKGDARAQLNLGTAYAEGKFGLKIDKKKALYYLSLSAEQCDANAQFNLGFLYYHGDGTERDVGEALRLFELAATQGHQQAQEALAILKGA